MSDDNWRRITAFVEMHKGELVLGLDWCVYRLVGCSVDDMDYYWDLQQVNGAVRHHTCVGRIIVLKGKINDDDYQSIEQVYKYNEEYRERDKNE